MILDCLDDKDLPKFLQITQKQLEDLFHEEKLNQSQKNLLFQSVDSLVFIVKRKQNIPVTQFLNVINSILMHDHK